MRIDCGDFAIRSYRTSDLDALVRYADNARVVAHLRDRFPHPYTVDDGLEWLAAAREQEPETNFAIEADGGLAGTVGLSLGEDVYRHSAEVGYWVGEPFWGRGIATAALAAITEWGFDRFGLLRIHAYVFSDNPASSRVLEKAGYRCEGTMRRAVVKSGRVLDQRIYARLAPAEDD